MNLAGMNPFLPLGSGLSDPPKFLAQLGSQALLRFGIGLFPDGVSPIQNTVVTICACHGYFTALSDDGSEARSLGAGLKRMLSRSLSALPVNRVVLSVADCPKRVEAPTDTKPHIITKDIPFSIIKAHNL